MIFIILEFMLAHFFFLFFFLSLIFWGNKTKDDFFLINIYENHLPSLLLLY
jgi:hypothetical protein